METEELEEHFRTHWSCDAASAEHPKNKGQRWQCDWAIAAYRSNLAPSCPSCPSFFRHVPCLGSAWMASVLPSSCTTLPVSHVHVEAPPNLEDLDLKEIKGVQEILETIQWTIQGIQESCSFFSLVSGHCRSFGLWFETLLTRRASRQRVGQSCGQRWSVFLGHVHSYSEYRAASCRWRCCGLCICTSCSAIIGGSP